MMSNKTTTLLSDLAAILPGIGLILGWILYPLYLTLTPEREIKIKVYEPIFKKIEFVKIPENQEFLGKPPSDVRPTDYRIVYKEIPILDKNGNPVFKHQEKSSSGKGVAKITEFEVKEILIPILKQPTWTYGDLELKPIVYEDPKPKHSRIPKPSKWMRIYQENIEYKSTGVFYEKKNVEFHPAFKEDGLAVRLATIASIISLILVIYKYCVKRKRHQTQDSPIGSSLNQTK